MSEYPRIKKISLSGLSVGFRLLDVLQDLVSGLKAELCILHILIVWLLIPC